MKARFRTERSGLLVAEWVFLFLGLMALDSFIWINASSVLYQAYEDWAFDQTLRGLTPSVSGFISDEARWLGSRGGEKAPLAESPQAPGAGLNEGPREGPASEEPNVTVPALRAVIGRLEIPRLKLSVMVREGADERTLSRAVGHIPGTALPGKMGNMGLAGHRDTFFRALRDIREDDAIEFETTQGTYRYLVKSTKIVGPRDVSVLATSGGENLTLVTCYPFYYVGSAPKRFIVHAAQVTAIPRRQQQPGS
jgi:sortase A